MPCVPIGITVMQGRTSRLNRFLSMPRYAGASRSRMNRVLLTQAFLAGVQVASSHNAVCEVLASATSAPQRTGMSAPSCRAGSAATERQAHLAPAEVGRVGAVWLPAGQKTAVVGHPIEHVVSQPANAPAVEYALWGESAEYHQPKQSPSRSASQARDVVRAQELIPPGEPLVDPGRKRNVLGDCRADARVRRGRGRHKRPATCGSGRLETSCHVRHHHAPEGKRVPD